MQKKTWTAKEKAEIVIEALRGEKAVNEIASAHGMHPNQLSTWKGEALRSMHLLFENETIKNKQLEKAHEAEVDELYRQIGKLTAQLDWAKKKSGQ
jgi:transposase-like protein